MPKQARIAGDDVACYNPAHNYTVSVCCSASEAMTKFGFKRLASLVLLDRRRLCAASFLRFFCGRFGVHSLLLHSSGCLGDVLAVRFLFLCFLLALWLELRFLSFFFLLFLRFFALGCGVTRARRGSRFPLCPLG